MSTSHERDPLTRAEVPHDPQLTFACRSLPLASAGANDGLVSIESAKWGQYQATLNNVNHLYVSFTLFVPFLFRAWDVFSDPFFLSRRDLVGWVGKVRYGWAEWLGKPIKFKPVSFFCAVAEMLADEDL